MNSNMKLPVRFAIALAALLSVGMSSDAFAQTAGCFTGPAKMSDSDISAFASTPGSLLSTNPTGGLPMTTQVRGLAGSSGSALDSLMTLVSQSNSAQKSAMGAGLGRAAKSCQASSPDYVQLIQEKVAASNDKDLTTAFIAAMSDIQTAALGGGVGAGGGGAGGIAGGGAANGATGSVGGDTPVASTTPTYSIGSRSGSTFTSTNSTVQFITNAVSP